MCGIIHLGEAFVHGRLGVPPDSTSIFIIGGGQDDGHLGPGIYSDYSQNYSVKPPGQRAAWES